MSETEKFLEATMPRLTEAETAIHNGDAGQWIAMWSRHEPVTLFGAAVTRAGGAEARRTLERLGTLLSDCTAFEIEVVAAGASGDLAYLVAFEHITGSVNGAPPEPYTLRATTAFRREDGEWRVVHRHGDSLKSVAGHRLAEQLQASDR
ncbi:MAG TPA: nuclear transport factor 2 family protein [Actinomycetes bacterium]